MGMHLLAFGVPGHTAYEAPRQQPWPAGQGELCCVCSEGVSPSGRAALQSVEEEGGEHHVPHQVGENGGKQATPTAAL